MLSFAEKWRWIGAFKERERRRELPRMTLQQRMALLDSLMAHPWPVAPQPDPVGPYSYEKRMEAARSARAQRDFERHRRQDKARRADME